MTANRKRLPAGKVMRLFMAGASIIDICMVYDCDVYEVGDALRRQIARMVRS